ncbi:MAG: PAS domain-containing protein, partial [Nannocystaceae bacterium]|nr:PAS domain-containing protein [Nannocystaceae bacterium]
MSSSDQASGFSLLPIAAFATDASGVVQDVNSRWTLLFSARRADAVGRKLWESLDDEFAAQVRKAWDGLAQVGDEIEIEGATSLPGHAEITANLRIEARRTPQGGVVGVVHDDTERRRGEAIRQRIAKWSKRLHLASTFAELIELAEVEAREVTPYNNFWLFIIPTDDSPFVKRLASSGAASGDQWEHAPTLDIATDALVQAVIASDGPVVVDDARTHPLTDKKLVAKLGSRTIINIPLRLLDHCLGAFGMGSFGEEGPRVPTAPELQYLQAMGAQIAVAAGRLRFLAQREETEKEHRRLELRLLRSQNLESLSVLAGGVAHDVNNLMTVVLGSVAEGLSALEPHQEAYEGLQHATTAAMRTVALARQMLAYAGQGTVMGEVGDLEELVDETVKLARVAVRNDVRVHFTPGPRRDITADLTQVRQLVMNLITNAAQAIDDGGEGEVHVSVEVETLTATATDDALAGRVTDGRYVCLEVADDGCGMSRATVDRVFDPFFTTKATGHGLGMSAVLGIVRGHNGAIWVKTELGRGTTFRVVFPLETQPAAMDDRTHDRPNVVLVADDERVIRR